jgi:hypothetical protein
MAKIYMLSTILVTGGKIMLVNQYHMILDIFSVIDTIAVIVQ